MEKVEFQLKKHFLCSLRAQIILLRRMASLQRRNPKIYIKLGDLSFSPSSVLSS